MYSRHHEINHHKLKRLIRTQQFLLSESWKHKEKNLGSKISADFSSIVSIFNGLCSCFLPSFVLRFILHYFTAFANFWTHMIRLYKPRSFLGLLRGAWVRWSWCLVWEGLQDDYGGRWFPSWYEVLVVDDDRTCLKVLETPLLKCH